MIPTHSNIHRPRNILFLLLLLSALLLSPVASAVTKHSETVSWAQWTAQANGTTLSALPQIRQILRLFEEDDNITVEIHYPSNDQNDNQHNPPGKSWADSLGRWLVTFGIPIRYIILFPDSDTDNQIVISLIDRR